MKLRTFKQLQNGIFKKRYIEDTQAGAYGFLFLIAPFFIAGWAITNYFCDLQLVWFCFWICAYYLYMQVLKIIIGYLYWCEVYITERKNKK